MREYGRIRVSGNFRDSHIFCSVTILNCFLILKTRFQKFCLGVTFAKIDSAKLVFEQFFSLMLLIHSPDGFAIFFRYKTYDNSHRSCSLFEI